MAPPIINISALTHRGRSDDAARARCIAAIGLACRQVGFFYITGHGVSTALQRRLSAVFARFFALPRDVKRRVEMARGGKAWRGYFEVGEELTSGIVDEKEGYYFGEELSAEDPRPLHGPNLFIGAQHGVEASFAAELRDVTLAYIDAMKRLGHVVLGAIAASLGLDASHFGAQFQHPTQLFRAFHYPPHREDMHPDSFAVGEHTDYGYITILKQDDSGGLQVRAGEDGRWLDAPPVPNSFVVNLGDALEYNTGSLFRATPHRVQARVGATHGRLSFPFFFDPSFDARLESVVRHLPPALRREAAKCQEAAEGRRRWDGKKLAMFSGTYGAYLLDKVSHVFPELAKEAQIREHQHGAGARGRL